MRIRKRNLLALLLLTLAVAPALAQTKVYRGDTVTVSGVVKDELGNPVAGATVQLLDGATLLDSTTTGSDGSFTLTWTVPPDHPLGPKTLTVYVPEQPSLYVEASSASVYVEIWALAVISASGPQRIHRGDEVTISGSVQGISSGTVEVQRDGNTIATGPVSGGQFSVSFTVPNDWQKGPVTLTVTCPSGSYVDVQEGQVSTGLWVRPTIEVTEVSGG